jgi:hypothetical protein
MKSYLAILRNILLVCFLFGFVNAEKSALKNESDKSCAVDTDSGQGILVQEDILDEQSDELDEQDDNFDEVQVGLLKAASLSNMTFGDISLDALDEIERDGPQELSLRDKIAIGWAFLKDATQQHVSKNKRKYICGVSATAAIILLVYYFGGGGGGGGAAMPTPN